MKSLAPLFVIALCIGAYFVYIKPMAVEVKINTIKKSQYTDVLNRVKEIKQKREEVLAEYNSISEEDIARLKKIIPETLNPVILSNDLSRLASDNQVTLKEFKVSDTNADTGAVAEVSESIYKKTTINMTFSGQYENFVRFLTDVESGLSLIDIVSLIIKSVDSSSGRQMPMDYVLEVNTYSLR